MREVGQAVQEGFEKGVLHQRPSVINLQCDVDHPTQAMADLMQVKNHFGSLEKLRGKKIAMTWAYSPSYGKPLSVPQGIIGLMTRFGMQVSLAYPEGYGLIPEVVELAKQNSRKSGGSFEVVSSMEQAFTGRGCGLSEIVGAVSRDAAAHAVAAQRRQGGAQSNWRRNAWPTTPSTRTGNATRRR